MKINAAFDQRVLLHADEIEWRSSPMPGVERRPLDRIGDEVARATSIVRYAPGSQFSAHAHGGGEEFLVLDGVFQDEHGDFPEGAYVRNPPGSKHTPASAPGCVIFVKLWQFDPADRSHVIIDTTKIGAVDDAGRPGVAVTPLFKDAREEVRIEEWTPRTRHALRADGGAELLVLEGSGHESSAPLRRHSWLRIPDGGEIALSAGETGLRFWLKLGHLRHVSAPGG